MKQLHDPRLLSALLALEEELHFGRAAAKLGIAQPQLSHLVKRAEALAGVALFERSTRSTTLTDAGRAIVDGARRAITEIEMALVEARQRAAGKSGTLDVGYVTIAMLLGLPAAVARFRQTHPGIQLRLHEVSTDAQLDQLLADKLDVAMLTSPLSSPRVRVLRKLPDRLSVVVPSRHPARRAHCEAAFAILATEPFVFFPINEATNFYSVVREFCHAQGLPMTPHQEAGSWYSILSLVSGGLGFTVAPACTKKFKIGSLAYLPLSAPRPEISVELCVKSENRSPLTTAFANAFDERSG